MDTIKLPSGHEVLVDKDDFERLSQFRYYLHKKGYAYRFDCTQSPKKAIYLHHDVLGKKEGFVVDHINHNKLDNRKINLRFATNMSNLHNSKKNISEYSSIYKGVSWNEKIKGWTASIKTNGTLIKLGLFSSEEAAANAYNDYAKRSRDQYTFLNDVPIDLNWKDKIIPDRRNGVGKSKYIGVSWSKNMNKWQCHIMVNYKSIYLGSFEDEMEAAKAYNEAALKYRGDKARLNMI